MKKIIVHFKKEEFERVKNAISILAKFSEIYAPHRVEEYLADELISIGDYVLTGGELGAMVIADAVSRMIPGVLGDSGSAVTDSFYEPILEYPQYTKPADFRGLKVPEVLLSAHHANIARWRRKEALRRTMKNRPDLMEKLTLSPEDKKLIREIVQEEEVSIHGSCLYRTDSLSDL